MISLLLAVIPLLPLHLGVSVTQCGADPTGNADSTGAFNACLSSVAAGDIFVPPGNYKIAGSIIKTRNQNLIGAGSKASVLNCQATTAPCIKVGDITGGPNNYTDSRIQDLTVSGPGTNNSSIGVYMGGDPAGVLSPSNSFSDFANFVDVRVTGFNRGIEWGNNTYCNKLLRTYVFGNATGLYVPNGLGNSGESIGLTDCVIFNNTEFGLDDHGNFEWMFSGTSFDYNATAIEFFGSTIHAVNCHFEQSGAQVVLQPYGSASLAFKDSEILIQSSTGSDNYILNTMPQNLNLAFDNLSIWSNHPVQYFMHTQGSFYGSINNLHGNFNKMIKALANGTISTVVTANSAF